MGEIFNILVVASLSGLFAWSQKPRTFWIVWGCLVLVVGLVMVAVFLFVAWGAGSDAVSTSGRVAAKITGWVAAVTALGGLAGQWVARRQSSRSVPGAAPASDKDDG